MEAVCRMRFFMENLIGRRDATVNGNRRVGKGEVVK